MPFFIFVAAIMISLCSDILIKNVLFCPISVRIFWLPMAILDSAMPV